MGIQPWYCEKSFSRISDGPEIASQNLHQEMLEKATFNVAKI